MLLNKHELSEPQKELMRRVTTEIGVARKDITHLAYVELDKLDPGDTIVSLEGGVRIEKPWKGNKLVVLDISTELHDPDSLEEAFMCIRAYIEGAVRRAEEEQGIEDCEDIELPEHCEIRGIVIEGKLEYRLFFKGKLVNLDRRLTSSKRFLAELAQQLPPDENFDNDQFQNVIKELRNGGRAVRIAKDKGGWFTVLEPTVAGFTSDVYRGQSYLKAWCEAIELVY